MASPMDMSVIGQRFGKLLVLDRLPGKKCRTRCDCGNEKDVLLQSLRNGDAKSCGCAKNEKPRKDISGQKINSWTILAPGDRKANGRPTWHVRCECGEERHHELGVIKAAKSCGCKNRLELVGETQGFLTCIADLGVQKNGRRLKCSCACGNEVELAASDFIEGAQKSCGCWKKRNAQERLTVANHMAGKPSPNRIDMTGQRYGSLVVREFVEMCGHKPIWKADCDCGREWVGVGHWLRSGNTKSCGKCRYDQK